MERPSRWIKCISTQRVAIHPATVSEGFKETRRKFEELAEIYKKTKTALYKGRFTGLRFPY